MEKKILVAYVGVMGIRGEDIDTFVHKVASKITPTTFEGEIIIIPVQSPDTRIECINPKYITETDLIVEHSKLMKELQYALTHQLDLLKGNNNE